MLVDTYEEYLAAINAVQRYEKEALGFIEQHLTHHILGLKITSQFDENASYIELLQFPMDENQETPVRIVRWSDSSSFFTVLVPAFVFDGVLMTNEPDGNPS